MKTLTKTASLVAAITIGLFITSCKKSSTDIALSTSVSASDTIDITPPPANGGDTTVYSHVQFIQASPDAGAASVYIANKMLGLTPSPYGGELGYFNATPSVPRESVDIKDALNQVIRSTTSGFYSGEYYSLFLVGEKVSNNLGIFVINDQRPQTPPASGRTQVRFINAAPVSPAVDVIGNDGAVKMLAQGFKGVTNYQDIPSGNYTFKVNNKGTNTTLTSLTTTLQSGKVYTFYTKDDIQGGKVVIASDIYAVE